MKKREKHQRYKLISKLEWIEKNLDRLDARHREWRPNKYGWQCNRGNREHRNRIMLGSSDMRTELRRRVWIDRYNAVFKYAEKFGWYNRMEIEA